MRIFRDWKLCELKSLPVIGCAKGSNYQQLEKGLVLQDWLHGCVVKQGTFDYSMNAGCVVKPGCFGDSLILGCEQDGRAYDPLSYGHTPNTANKSSTGPPTVLPNCFALINNCALHDHGL